MKQIKNHYGCLKVLLMALSLSAQTQVIYKTSEFWHKDYERSLSWEDCELKIKWPINKESMNNLKLSEKDSEIYY